ncbi:ComEC/Rec2 family competence protein [Streptomyces sp. NPDC004610]|uniref:ComEC/Rec2 family competence protein n=1 Tax=unclassified Streptomyces TaxID=2593676 RepID=UPI0033BA0849
MTGTRTAGMRGSLGRRAVHADADSRLGHAHPRQEGPTDLRLVPPALAAWAMAAVALDLPPGWVVGVSAGCLVGAGLLLVPWRRGHREGAGAGARARLRVTVGAVLLCVAAAAATAGMHGADLRRGPVPELAGRFASVTAEVTVTADPRLSRPRISGDRAVPASVLVPAEVVAVEAGGGGAGVAGTRTLTRTPVLVIVDSGERGGGGAGSGAREGGAVGSGGRSGGLVGSGEGSGGGAEFGARGDRADRAAADGAGREGVAVVESAGRGGVAVVGGAGREGVAVEEGAVPESGAVVRSPWLGLLPSTRVRVEGRLAPVTAEGGRLAAVLRVREPASFEVVAGPSASQRFAGRLRAGLREATDGLPADARALLPGLVVGDTSRITPELDEAFKETDLTHLLAVSGSNLTIVLALLLGPPGLAQRAERRGAAARFGLSLRATAVCGGVLTLAFVVVCRPDPSVLRAAACGAVVLLALATGRRRSLIPALATAVLLLVLYDPWLARSYGFLLSVLATGALLTLAPRWSVALRRRGVPSGLAEALAAAGAAQALCAPVVTVLSARVSLVAVPCNLLAEFAVAPATVLGFAALAVAPLALPVAEALAWCAGWPTGWIAGIARTGAALPGAGIDWPGSWAGAALLALVTAGALYAGRRMVARPWLCAVCALLLALIVVRPAPLTRVITGWPPPGWRLAMCDVGQGDATVLAAGEGSGVVVDAGPDPGAVDRCLRALGITRVPLVVLTHFHADHVAGLPGVLRGRAVAAIETTGHEEPADQAAFVRREAAARGVPVRRAVAGEVRGAGGGLGWQVLWPPREPVPPPEGPNDASVTMLVRSGGLRMLLLGDLEPPAQQALLRSPAAALLRRVDVLKVAHHGSAYQDPGLLRAVAPRVALISCGRDNRYGHPAPSTVAALRSAGARVLRTDQEGSLAVTGGDGTLRVAGD